MIEYFKTPIGKNVFYQKYALTQSDTWPERCRTVVDDVCGTMSGRRRRTLSETESDYLIKIMTEMKFLPGGRYLYYAGRPAHYFNNCFMLRAEEDTREEWAALAQRATSCLMVGGGIGVDYTRIRPKGRNIKRTGGVASGPLSLMYMINEIGRNVMQGGSRRSAIYASLNWKHEDAHEFISAKDWSKMPISGCGDYTVSDAKKADFNYSAPLDMTNISLNYDDSFLNACKDGTLPDIFIKNVKSAMQHGEPGFSFNFGVKQNETLRNACQPSYATVLTPNGISTMGEIKIGDIIWSGKKWTKVTNKISTGIKNVYEYKTTTGKFIGTQNHRICQNGEKIEVRDATSIDWNVGDFSLLTTDYDSQSIMDGLIIGDGSVHKASNDLIFLYIGEKDYDYFDSEISDLITRDRRVAFRNGWKIKTTINSKELPKTFNRVIPDKFYFGDQKTKRSFLRGLFSANGSISGNRITLKQTSKILIEQVQEMLSSIGIHSYITINKGKIIKFSNGEYQCKKSYDLNITSGRDIFKNHIGFIQKYKQSAIIESSKPKYLTSDIKEVKYLGEDIVYDITVEADEHTYWTGGCLVSNCTELTSEDDSDVCNLGSINIGNIETIEEFKDIINVASKFLVCGTLRADLPYNKVKEVREKNRRIGLGLMGIHEWLLKRNYRYEMNDELKEWLQVYKEESERSANEHCDRLYLNRPAGYRAIAPTGTIGILAGTTTGIEPLYAVAYKRRYLTDGTNWKYEYVIDSTAELLINEYGIDPDSIETSVDLAKDPERRISFQADVQDYVDHSISSTINLPEWGSEFNNDNKVYDFANLLAKYAPRLRGFTCYPDGSRGGQPLTSVPYTEAKGQTGIVFSEHDICTISGKGGTCGS